PILLVWRKYVGGDRYALQRRETRAEKEDLGVSLSPILPLRPPRKSWNGSSNPMASSTASRLSRIGTRAAHADLALSRCPMRRRPRRQSTASTGRPWRTGR